MKRAPHAATQANGDRLGPRPAVMRGLILFAMFEFAIGHDSLGQKELSQRVGCKDSISPFQLAPSATTLHQRPRAVDGGAHWRPKSQMTTEINAEIYESTAHRRKGARMEHSALLSAGRPWFVPTLKRRGLATGAARLRGCGRHAANPATNAVAGLEPTFLAVGRFSSDFKPFLRLCRCYHERYSMPLQRDQNHDTTGSRPWYSNLVSLLLDRRLRQE
jgi:hypothetical protein